MQYEESAAFSLVVDASIDPPTVVPTGELDMEAADYFRDTLLDLISDGAHDLQVDLGGLDFMDSTGLNALILVHKRLAGSLILVDPPVTVVRMLEATSLTEMFAVR